MNNIKLLKAQAKLALSMVEPRARPGLENYIAALEARVSELEAAQTRVQADGDYCTCKPYPHEVIRDGVWLCSYCYRPRRYSQKSTIPSG